MAVSQNGYPANDPSALGSFVVSDRTFRVRKGPCLTVLKYVVTQFDKRVEPIDPPSETELDDWSYAERPIRGQTTVLSNHASGTAVDLNSTKHPQGTEPSANFSEKQIETIFRILNEVGGVVRWGGTYDAPSKKDGMHFEINAPEAMVAEAARRLPKEEDDVANTPEELQKAAEAGAYAAITRYERERHAVGQPTPQESYQSSDDVLAQLRAIGSSLSDLKAKVERLTPPAQG